MQETYFSVSELNSFIKGVINNGFPEKMWICGEIQQYDRNKGKRHVFFELVEKNPRSKDIIAKIGLVIFANRKFFIEDVLKRSENAFLLKDDIEVKFECRVDFYAPHGVVRLIVENIDPSYTLGKLAQEKQRLIALLKKEGVFEKNKLLDLTEVPLKIGLISSDDSAAYNDFLSELNKSKIGFQIYFRNALMQGKKSEEDVCCALDDLEKIKNLDAIVITRGGGSLADLSCFDSKKIACKIASLSIPVLSGIGHEINITITDMSAHTYAKTPTAIAQFLVASVTEYVDALDQNGIHILTIAQQRVRSEKQRLKNFAGRLQNSTLEYLRAHDQKLIRFQEVLKHRPQGILENAKKTLEHMKTDLNKSVEALFFNLNNKLSTCQKILDIANPVNILKRGFTITRFKDGKIVKSLADIQGACEIETELVDGIIESNVIKVKGKGVKDGKD